MKLGLKITVFVVSCFLLQGQGVQAAKTDATAIKVLNDTMNGVVKIFDKEAYSLQNLLNMLNGLEQNRERKQPLEVESEIGENPVLVVEEKADGTLEVLASRRGRYEAGVNLTDDNTHQAIVKKIKEQGTNKAVVYDYQDKTGAWFKVIAWPIDLLEKDLSPDKRTQGRFIYAASEVEINTPAASEKVG